MKTAIVYFSEHHGNTKKLLDAIAVGNDVILIDATKPHITDLTEYDAVGFASGIYFQKYHASVIKFAETYLPEDKPVFFVYTYGFYRSVYAKDIREVCITKHAKVLGRFGCLGLDTFGPFKLVGGIAKGHPTEVDLHNAVSFYNKLKK